ncbi:hypothetical protein ACS0TY_021987 [Phlomoides rotata]
MPGTIQVTVLEFKGGFSSSSKPSAKSLKVSMGKRQFHTWDKGDFSFPITKVGEDLVVSLLDAGGNEIAHQDIRTMQIIEKGDWDEVFAIDGGGNVHMKLRFVLSEEERHRIRLMRESAVKKKLETNPNIKLRLSQVSDSADTTSTKNEHKISDSQKGCSEVSPKVEASQAGSSMASATSSVIPPSLRENIPESTLIPDATDGSQGDKHEVKSESPKMQETEADHELIETQPLANVRSEGPRSPTSDRNNTVAPKLHDDKDSVEKTRSNVKKMISALENSKVQEVKSMKKASSVPAHELNRFRKATALAEDQESETDKSAKPVVDIVPSDHGSSQAPKQLSPTETLIPSGGNDLQKLKISPLDLTRQSTSETATSSGRMPEEQTQPRDLSINSTESSVVQGRGTSLKSSSNKKPTLEYYNEESCWGQSSGMWIFPDNTRRLCITTAGNKVEKTVENVSSKSNVLDKNVVHETEFETEKKQNKAEEGSGSSPNDSSNGVVGKVIKIGVIIGFGVLVLFTRQKEPSPYRKKHREENDNLFHHVPKYV